MTNFIQNDLSRYSSSSSSSSIGNGGNFLPSTLQSKEPYKAKYMKPMICANGGKLNYWVSSTSTNISHNTTTKHKTALNANYTDIKIQVANWWVSSSGESITNVSTTVYQASVQIGATIYQGVSKLTLNAGESGTISINGLSLNAGQEFYVHLHAESESGKVVCRGKSVTTSPMFDTGSIAGTDTAVNIAVTGIPYGSTATCIVSSNNITALTLTAGGSGFLNNADVYAYEMQSNGLLAKKLIGTATVSGGTVTALTLTDGTPPTGVTAWVTPTIAISHGGLMTLAAHTGTGPIPAGIIGTPSVPVRAIMGVGGTDMYGSEQSSIADASQNIGSFELGLKNKCGFAACAVSAVSAQNYINNLYSRSVALYVPYVTDCIMHFGNFDVLNSRTNAQIRADIATMKARVNALGVPVTIVSEGPFQAAPNSAGYATLVGQTNAENTTNNTSYGVYTDAVTGVIPSDFPIIDYGTMMRSDFEPKKWDVVGGQATTGGIAPEDNVSLAYNGYARAGLDAKFQRCFNIFSYINIALPVVTGNLVDGGNLSVIKGTWYNDPPLNYKWYRNGVEIPNSGRRTYSATSADVGQAITVKEFPSTYEAAGVFSNQSGTAEKNVINSIITGNASCTLTWSVPTTYTYPITDYRIDYKLRTATTWTTFSHSASTATSITVTGLTNSSLYDFRVAAVTSIGTALFSDTKSATPYAILDKIADTTLLGYWDGGFNETVISGNATAVERWNDISGLGNNMLQNSTTTADKPSKGLKTINSLPVLDFNGTAAYMNLPTSISNTLATGDCAMFFVYQLDSTGTGKTIVLITDPSSNFFVYVRGDVNDVIAKANTGVGSTQTLTTNSNVHIIGVRRASNNIKVYVDGGAGGTTSSAGDVTTSGLLIGRLHGSYGQLDGNIGAVALYDGSLTLTRFNEVGQALATRFGTTWTTAT